MTRWWRWRMFRCRSRRASGLLCWGLTGPANRRWLAARWLYFCDLGPRFHFTAVCWHPEAFIEDEFAFDFRSRVGLVFQNPEVQLFNPTVFDEVAFAPLQLRWPKEQIVERVSAVLDLMEIGYPDGGFCRRNGLSGVRRNAWRWLGAGARSGSPAAGRADGGPRSAQREPDHRYADRLGRWRAHRDHGHARSGTGRRYRRVPLASFFFTKAESRLRANRCCYCAINNSLAVPI